MFETVITQLPKLSMIDVEVALADTFDRELFEAFEKNKAAGTLNLWFNTQLSVIQKQQMANYMERERS